jgi:hypothetical protein
VIASLDVDPEMPPQTRQGLVSAERQRILNLEKTIREVEAENVSLSQQVQYWTKASKKNQEARLTADASRATLTIENEELKLKVSELSSRRETNEEIRSLESKLLEKTAKLDATESVLNATQSRITEFEQSLEDALTSVEDMEKENESLRDQLEKKETAVLELREQVALLMEESASSPNQKEDLPALSRSINKPLPDVKHSTEATLPDIPPKDISLAYLEVSRDKLALEEKLEAVELDLAEIQFEKSALTRKLEDTELRLKKTEGMCQDLRQQNESQTANLSQLSSPVEDPVDFSQLKRINETLEWEIIELKAKLLEPSPQVNEELLLLRKRVIEVETELQETRDSFRDTATLLSELKDKEEELVTMQQRVMIMQGRVLEFEELEKYAVNLRNILNDREKQLKSIVKNQLADREHKLQGLLDEQQSDADSVKSVQLVREVQDTQKEVDSLRVISFLLI